MSNKAFIISAPAGTGKTTLANKLIQEFPRIKMSISYTTRQPRGGEVDGREYHFVSEATFEKMIQENDFLEYAKVFDHYYGTSKKALSEQLAQGFHVLLVIDTQGAMNIMKSFPVSSIFILPPSVEELKRRLNARGTDSKESIEQRLSWAKKEMDMAPLYNYTIINKDLNEAYGILRSIFIAEEHRNTRRTDES